MSIIPLNNQIANLSRDVAETNNSSDAATLLLKLRDILDSNLENKDVVIKEIWKYNLPKKLLEAFQEDFKLIPGEWLTACQLCNIAVDCCHHSVNLQELKKNYIPKLTYSMLNLCKVIVDEYNTAGKVFKSGLSGNLSWIITSITHLMESFIFVTVSVVSSKQFMQLLMTEDSKLSLLSLALLRNIIQTNCDVFYHASESRMHSVADELAFKISSAQDVNVARLSISILLNLIRMYTTLLDLFVTKRYKGFKTYITKWKRNGFDQDIESVIVMIEEKTKKMQKSRIYDNAATVIQSCYRSYKTRKKLRSISRSIAVFQRRYREKMRAKRERNEKVKRAKVQTHHAEKRRREGFVKAKSKQLQVIEGIPARTVNKFLDDLQNDAARKIQAAWSGWKTRNDLKDVAPHLKQYRAAVAIQRQIRLWLERCRLRKKEARIEMLPEGLSDLRRVELQNVITNIREKFPKNDVADEEMFSTHEKAFRMLNNHVIGLRAMRRRDEHRRALIGQLSIQSDQMSRMPLLDKVDDNTVREFSSRSTPVMVAARRKHISVMNELTKPWWQKLSSEEQKLLGESSDPPVIFQDYIQDEEKNF